MLYLEHGLLLHDISSCTISYKPLSGNVFLTLCSQISVESKTTSKLEEPINIFNIQFNNEISAFEAFSRGLLTLSLLLTLLGMGNSVMELTMVKFMCP